MSSTLKGNIIYLSNIKLDQTRINQSKNYYFLNSVIFKFVKMDPKDDPKETLSICLYTLLL